jgi:LysM repeat protein
MRFRTRRLACISGTRRFALVPRLLTRDPAAADETTSTHAADHEESPMHTYTVQPGDTLGKIAARFYGTAGKFPPIVAANAMADPDRLLVGQSLVIPNAAVIAARNGDGTPPAPVTGKRALSLQRLAKLDRGLGLARVRWTPGLS